MVDKLVLRRSGRGIFGGDPFGTEGRLHLTSALKAPAPTPAPDPASPASPGILAIAASYVPEAVTKVFEKLADINLSVAILCITVVVAILVTIVAYYKWWGGSGSIDDGRVLNGIITSRSVVRCAPYSGDSTNFNVRFWLRVKTFDTSHVTSRQEADLTTNLITILGGDLTKGERVAGGTRLNLPCFDNYIVETNKLFTVGLLGDNEIGCTLIVSYSGLNNERLVVRQPLDMSESKWQFCSIDVSLIAKQPVLSLILGNNPKVIKRGSFTDTEGQPMEIAILGNFTSALKCSVMDYDVVKLRMTEGTIDPSNINLERLGPTDSLSETLEMSTSCSANYRAPRLLAN